MPKPTRPKLPNKSVSPEGTDSQTKESIFGKFGCVHVSVILKLQKMSYRNARKYLKDIWLTKSEQDALLRLTDALATHLKESNPPSDPK